jgi:phosphoribosylanthranilate isomerase
MTPRIKVCGFTRAADIHAALDAGVDLIGLNLARGPRRLELAQAVELARLVPPGVGVVALFVDADEATMLAAAAALRVAALQLHGDESPDLCQRIRARVPLIKAFRVAQPEDLQQVLGFPADACLLDAAVPGVHGGTGKAWDHGWLAGARLGLPLMLAGGMTPASVGAAIRATRPWAVDTASGVEQAPGCKDPTLLSAFVQAVKSA